MKWRDAHVATLARYGGRLPTENEAQVGDVLVDGCVLETDDAPAGGRMGRWRITVDPAPRGKFDERGQFIAEEAPAGPGRRWHLWDMRAHVQDQRSPPEAVAMGLPSPRSAVFLAEALNRSRLLRMAHAGLVGLSRAVAGMRREWRS